MKRHSSSSSIDRISELPCDITQTILTFLPLEDMVRTSVLSRNWRFRWTKVPQLIFPYKFHQTITAERVLEILLLHEGPILKFTLGVEFWDGDDDYSKINAVIRYLSRNGIQELIIDMTYRDCFTLPSSIFDCLELKNLCLYDCVVKPFTFDGFNKLITLELIGVELGSHVFISSSSLENLTMVINTKVDQFSIDAPNLKFLHIESSISSIGFINTPLLKVLTLIGDPDIHGVSSLDLMELLCRLPGLESLDLDYTFLKSSLGVSPNKWTVLNNLRKLDLVEVSLDDMGQFLSILWLIRNSPNLLRIRFERPQAMDFESEDGLKIQDPFLYRLVKLQELEIEFPFYSNYNNLRPDIEFMKFLLDISPELEKFYIGPPSKPLDKRQSKMLLELECYCCASPKAEIVLI